jgi:class II aldolase/adducin N-terminal domain-containing protein
MTVTETPRSTTDDYAAEEARLRRELAAVYRLVAHYKMTDLIYNHISVRLPGPEHRFLLNPFGLLYEEVTASNLVIVGLDGELVTDGPWKVNAAGFVIHSAIHAAREDALCVLHTHTKAGRLPRLRGHRAVQRGEGTPGRGPGHHERDDLAEPRSADRRRHAG